METYGWTTRATRIAVGCFVGAGLIAGPAAVAFGAETDMPAITNPKTVNPSPAPTLPQQGGTDPTSPAPEPSSPVDPVPPVEVPVEPAPTVAPPVVELPPAIPPVVDVPAPVLPPVEEPPAEVFVPLVPPVEEPPAEVFVPLVPEEELPPEPEETATVEPSASPTPSVTMSAAAAKPEPVINAPAVVEAAVGAVSGTPFAVKALVVVFLLGLGIAYFRFLGARDVSGSPKPGKH